MNAALMTSFRAPLEPTRVPDPEPDPHGLVLEVRASGVCRSDWHAWMGHDATVTLPHVPGHEMAGIVVAVGAEVSRVDVGQRITVPFCCGCGSCSECATGHQNLCEHEYQPGFDGWGSFAEYVAIPWADVNAVPLPDGVGYAEAASLGCRFMTSFRGLIDRARLTAGETLAVFGCGGVGLSCVAIGAAAGARVIAVDLEPSKLALARELGACIAIDGSAGDAAAAVRDATDGGAHVAVDALGAAVTATQALRSLRKRGRHLQIGLLLGDDARPRLPLHEAIKKELTLLGSHGMQAHRYDAMLSFVADKAIPIGRLVGDRIPLAGASAALAAMTDFSPVGVTIVEPFA